MAGSRLVLPSQQPVQSTGLPYPGGQLFFYLSGTSTPTPTYSDSALTIPNTNPVILDSAGDAGNVFLVPSVVYKIVLEDANGNLIWTFDPVTPFAPGSITSLLWGGVSTGSANAQIVSGTTFSAQPGQAIIFQAGFSNTASMTLNAGTGNIPVYQPTTTGAKLLSGGEVQVGATYIVIYNPNLNTGAGGFQLIAPFSLAALGLPNLPLAAPQGRLTLASGQPVMAGTVAASGNVYFTPYLGGQVPVWDGAKFIMTPFTETVQAMSDTTFSPAAGVGSTGYDYFIWANGSTILCTRGPAWTNATTRSAGTALTTVGGYRVNSVAITNGPGAGFGVYAGSVFTDSAGATVTWNHGGSASGGSAAFLNVWNMYNRVPVGAKVLDNGSGYSSLQSSYTQARASTGNQINFFAGLAENAIEAFYAASFQAGNLLSCAGNIGLDSTTVPLFAPIGGAVNNGGGTSGVGGSTFTGMTGGTVAAQIGSHFLAAIEEAQSNVNVTADLFSQNTLSAMFWM